MVKTTKPVKKSSVVNTTKNQTIDFINAITNINKNSSNNNSNDSNNFSNINNVNNTNKNIKNASRRNINICSNNDIGNNRTVIFDNISSDSKNNNVGCNKNISENISIVSYNDFMADEQKYPLFSSLPSISKKTYFNNSTQGLSNDSPTNNLFTQFSITNNSPSKTLSTNNSPSKTLSSNNSPKAPFFEPEPIKPNKVYGLNFETQSWHCLLCGEDMGINNPRQLCGKTFCENI